MYKVQYIVMFRWGLAYFSRSAEAARAAAEDGRDSCCCVAGWGVLLRDLLAD